LSQQWIDELPLEEKERQTEQAAMEERKSVAALRANPRDGGFGRAVDAMLKSTRRALMIVESLDSAGNDLDAAARREIVSRGYACERDEVRGLFARFVPAEQRIRTLGASFKSQDV